jgi:hypothetical protein
MYGMINDEVKTDDVNTVDSKAKMNKGHHVHLLDVVSGDRDEYSAGPTKESSSCRAAASSSLLGFPVV